MRSESALGPDEENSARTFDFVTAATAIARDAVAGDPIDPRPTSPNELPAAATGTTPAAAAPSTARSTTFRAGSVSKLAEGHVEDVHAVAYCRLDAGDHLARVVDEAEVAGRAEHLVVADVRARRASRQRARDPRPAPASRCRRRCPPRACRAATRAGRTACGRAARSSSPGANARATTTFGVVKLRLALREARRIAVAGGLKNGCDWLTPSSMIPIFTPLPAVGSVGPPQRSSAPISVGTTVETWRRTGPRRVRPGSPRWRRAGAHHAQRARRNAVEDDRVPPADRRGGNAGADASLHGKSLALEPRRGSHGSSGSPGRAGGP